MKECTCKLKLIGFISVLQDTVAIRKIDLQNVILPRPKEMSEEELPSLDLGGDDGIQDENASVAIFAGDAKDLFPTPSTVIDPTGNKLRSSPCIRGNTEQMSAF